MKTIVEEKQVRGKLTERIKQKAKDLLGYSYEINTVELRLMAYIQYVMVNTQKIEPRKINAEEREILSKWRKAGYIKGGASGLTITEEFWLIINQIIFLGYVDLTD